MIRGGLINLLSLLLIVAGCSREKIVENRSNCILVSTIQEGKKIDEYLIDNGLDGTVDLFLRCERDNYANSRAYLSSHTFNSVRKIQGNSKLVYQIRHPEDGKDVQILAETQVIGEVMQIELNKKYSANKD
ncbi:hypothetical protein FJZ21_02315 [Candidatus Pacearchaeota archaeon]|nr:hypothetical protein [Candidatus Pacearchaeota archaeon]